MMVHRAAQTALNLQQKVGEVQLAPDVKLTVKLGIGVGKATVLHLGGVHQRLEFLACGKPLMQAYAAEHHAGAGHTILSAEAFAMVKDKFDYEAIPGCNDVRILSTKVGIRTISVKK